MFLRAGAVAPAGFLSLCQTGDQDCTPDRQRLWKSEVSLLQRVPATQRSDDEGRAICNRFLRRMTRTDTVSIIWFQAVDPCLVEHSRCPTTT